MNRKILVGLFGVLLLIAFVTFFWLFLQQRKQQLQPTEAELDAKLSPIVEQAEKAENYAQTILLRGHFTEYNADRGWLSIIPEVRTITNQVEQRAVVEVDLTQVPDAACWPETTTINGQDFPLKDSYFPLAENSVMYYQGEQYRPLLAVLPQLTKDSYVMVVLQQANPDLHPGNPNPPVNPTLVAKQVVVLGCP